MQIYSSNGTGYDSVIEPSYMTQFQNQASEKQSTLIEKNITENGEYPASDDNADGYSKVTVDVPNTYTAEDEGKVVDNGALVAQTAMTEEITENGVVDTTLYDSVTVNVSSSGGSSGNDVIFYDYDGSVVTSYSAADFANLSVMPANPTHTGLTGQGWNWSLSDAKAYVAANGKLNIGQMYITSDGKTRLYFTVTKDNLSADLYLNLASNTELDVDWGDGSEHTTWTSNDGDSSKLHEYASAGRYVINITVVTGEFNLSSSVVPDIYKVEIGNSVTSIGNSVFGDCAALSSITIPNSVTSIGDSVFYDCYALSSITIPNGVTSIGDSVFYDCAALSSITIPNSVTSIGDSVFYDCYALSSITIPNRVTSISGNAFRYCYALSSITIPDSVTSIGDRVFDECNALLSITFERTTPPTLDGDIGLPTTCIIRVPQGSLSVYTSASNYPDPSVYIYEEY